VVATPEDLIPSDHVCFLVEEFMDQLDYSEFDIRYSGVCHPAYHRRILLKLLMRGILDRVRIVGAWPKTQEKM